MLRQIGLVLGVFVILGGIIAACGGSGDAGTTQLESDPGTSRSAELPSNDITTGFDPEARDNTSGTNTEQVQRIVIKSATLSITVENVSEKVASITAIAEDMGGWVVSSIVRGNDESRSGTISIRVPAEQFNHVIESIKLDAEKVNSEQINGQDVTEEYTDLQSRLRNLQAAESQMQTFLEDAQDTDDVLRIYNELVSLRGEIEVAQGRINLLQDSASYSSISVSIAEVSDDDDADEDEDNPWKPGETIGNAFDSLVVALRAVVDVTIWLLIFAAPLAIVVGVPGWLGWRFVGKRLRREQSPTPLESDEE